MTTATHTADTLHVVDCDCDTFGADWRCRINELVAMFRAGIR